MRAQLSAALIGAIVALTQGSLAADVRVLSTADLIAEIRQSGHVDGPATVDDDVDLGQLGTSATPARSAIEFANVSFRGRLTGIPAVRLRFHGGSICGVDATGRDWPQPIEFQGVTIGAMQFSAAQLRAASSCVECTVCRARFETTRFADEATFTGTHFGVPPGADMCRASVRASCGDSDFAEAEFGGVARFDRASFQTRASFDGAEFRSSARFAGIEAAHGIGFIGTRFRRDAEFRDCLLTDAYFGPNGGQHSTFEATEFGARADFRDCRFSGTTRFDAAVFAGDSLFARARFSGAIVSLLGAQSAHSIDLRGLALPDAATRLALDATAADTIRLDWDVAGPAVLRALPALPAAQQGPTLEALAHNLGEHGEARAALSVAFASKQVRRSQLTDRCGEDSVIGCAASEAEWWLWTWPTRNGSDPTWPLLLLAVLWATTALAGLPRGRLLAVPGEPIDGGPYRCVPVTELPDGAHCPIGWIRRVELAFGFATRIVFKLGSSRPRMAEPIAAGQVVATNVALRLAWLLGWGLMAVVAAVIASSFPGLRSIVP